MLQTWQSHLVLAIPLAIIEEINKRSWEESTRVPTIFLQIVLSEKCRCRCFHEDYRLVIIVQWLVSSSCDCSYNTAVRILRLWDHCYLVLKQATWSYIFRPFLEYSTYKSFRAGLSPTLATQPFTFGYIAVLTPIIVNQETKAQTCVSARQYRLPRR